MLIALMAINQPRLRFEILNRRGNRRCRVIINETIKRGFSINTQRGNGNQEGRRLKPPHDTKCCIIMELEKLRTRPWMDLEGGFALYYFILVPLLTIFSFLLH